MRKIILQYIHKEVQEKMSRGSRGKSKRTKRSDGDQGVVTTTAYQLPQFTDNEVVRMMCSVNLYLLRMKAVDNKFGLPYSDKGNV